MKFQADSPNYRAIDTILRTPEKKTNMQMLYDSESFVVVHVQTPTLSLGGDHDLHEDAEGRKLPAMPRHGFEIVDKRSGKELYLDGSWAEMFQEQILAWQRNSPTQEEVESTLERYAELAQNPVVMH